MQAEFELVMNKDGLSETGSDGNSHAAWKQILYAVESGKAFYVHVSALRAFVIPKALLTPQEDAVIRKLLPTHLAPKRCRIRR